VVYQLGKGGFVAVAQGMEYAWVFQDKAPALSLSTCHCHLGGHSPWDWQYVHEGVSLCYQLTRQKTA
jgi:hypothetical protein